MLISKLFPENIQFIAQLKFVIECLETYNIFIFYYKAFTLILISVSNKNSTQFSTFRNIFLFSFDSIVFQLYYSSFFRLVCTRQNLENMKHFSPVRSHYDRYKIACSIKHNWFHHKNYPIFTKPRQRQYWKIHSFVSHIAMSLVNSILNPCDINCEYLYFDKHFIKWKQWYKNKTK